MQNHAQLPSKYAVDVTGLLYLESAVAAGQTLQQQPTHHNMRQNVIACANEKPHNFQQIELLCPAAHAAACRHLNYITGVGSVPAGDVVQV